MANVFFGGVEEVLSCGVSRRIAGRNPTWRQRYTSFPRALPPQFARSISAKWIRVESVGSTEGDDSVLSIIIACCGSQWLFLHRLSLSLESFFFQVPGQTLGVLRHAFKRPGDAHSLERLPSKHPVLVEVRLYL